MKLITVANPQSKEQAVLNKQADSLLGYFMDQGPRMQLQTGVKMGWTRLYDMAGISTSEQRDHRQQRLGQGCEEPGPAAALPARLAARLGVHRRATATRRPRSS